MIAVKNEACVPVIKTSDEHLHVFTSTMPTQLPGLCCMPRNTTCFKKSFFLANTLRSPSPPSSRNWVCCVHQSVHPFITVPPQCHLSILGFTLTIQQKKLSTAATELVPQRRCEIRSYVPSYKAQSGGICVCISEVTEVTAGKTAGNDDDNVCIAKKLS